MTIKAIVKEWAKREGLRKQVDIAQLTELAGHMSDMVFENYNKHSINPDVTATACIDIVFYNNGAKRARKKAKPQARKKGKRAAK